MFTLLPFSSPAAAQDDNRGFLGSVEEVPSQRPQLEPDRYFAGNDTFVLDQLRAYHKLGPEHDLRVMSELETFGLRRIPPPFLVEYARRQKSQGDPNWDVTWGVANTRMMYDRLSCVDRSAQQFQSIVLLEFSRKFPEFNEAYNSRSQERQNEATKIGFESGEFFSSEASAWWICSHGMFHMAAAIDGETVQLEDWWVGNNARAEVKAQGEAAFRGALYE